MFEHVTHLRMDAYLLVAVDSVENKKIHSTDLTVNCFTIKHTSVGDAVTESAGNQLLPIRQTFIDIDNALTARQLQQAEWVKTAIIVCGKFVTWEQSILLCIISVIL